MDLFPKASSQHIRPRRSFAVPTYAMIAQHGLVRTSSASTCEVFGVEYLVIQEGHVKERCAQLVTWHLPFWLRPDGQLLPTRETAQHRQRQGRARHRIVHR